MKKIIWIFLICISSFQALLGQAWPENVVDFEDEIKKRLGKIKNEGVEQFLKSFPDKWETGGLNTSDKKMAIQQINQLQKKGFLPYPDVTNYLNTIFALKNFETKIRISPDEFFKVSQSCIDKLKPAEIKAFYTYITNYIKEGIAFKTSQFNWRFTKTEPRLLMRAEMDSSTGKISEFPCFQFMQTDLVYTSKTDTGIIANTKGIINLTTKKFSGEGGRYDWSRLGLPKESVYCMLDTFKVDLSLQHFKADSVTFYYTTLIPRPLRGVLIEHFKSVGEDKSKSEFPYFKSSEGGITIDNLIRNVSYYGGFSLKGLTKYGSKTETEYASLLINNREGKKVLKLYSDEFILDPKQLTTKRAAVTLYVENDSLTHPAMKLQYDVESGDMTLWRDPKDINSHQPIMSSYHRMGFWVEALSWNSNKDIMEFTSFIDKGNKISALESYDFFLQQQFKQFRGVLTFYPLGMLYRYWTEVLKSGKKADTYKVVEEYSGWETEEEDTSFKKDPPDDFVPVIDTTDSPVIQTENKPIPKIFIDNFLTWGDTLGLKIDSKVFDKTQEANRVAKGWRKLTEQKEAFKRMLVELEGAGFVDFVSEEGYVILKGKLARWARAARDLKDYDIIQLQSQVDQGKNGEFNVKTQQIRMYGVYDFPLSDSQYVFVKPYKSQAAVDKNRTIEMGGLVDAGKLTFFGKGFKKYKYEYINHKILCDSLDSLKFVPERDPKFQNGGTNTKLANAIKKLKVQGVNGAIYINKPNNKNSRKKHPEYPVFDCYSESYVYWDEKGVQGGVYDKDSMRFTIDPFIIDSLENFDMRALEFQGELYAGGIMPSFRDTLKPMNDDTYGVQMITDKGGVPLYGEKGKFFNKIEVDGHGMHGNGDITYLATTATSDSFFFHFDSVMAVTKTFELKQGNYGSAVYPQIDAKKVLYKWYTKKDELVLQSDETPFDLFEKRAKLDGQIKITPTGVKADGIFTMDELSIEARDMDLGQFKFETPTGRLQVADKKDVSFIHFVADSVKIKYDVNADTANIEANKNGIAFCQFPGAKFKTSLGMGTYNKKTGDIDLSARSSYGENNYFESTEPKLHGLRFIAKESHYNVNKKEIDVKGADSILVADAVVFPDSGNLKIRDDGYLSKLNNAKITANRETRYHNVFGAEVNVRSKIDYVASGKYKYINDQNIYFADLYVRKDTVTQGVGLIPESQKFFITDRIYFKDSVVVKADHKHLFFDGVVKIQSKNPFLQDAWFEFPKEPAEPVAVNPDTIFIPINKPENRSKEELTVGLEYLPFRRTFYSNFLQIRREKKDQDVLTAKGGLSVDRVTDEFKIGTMEKILGKSYKGRLVSYNDSTRIITSRGLVGFPYHKAPETAQYKMAGKFVDDPGTQKLTADVVMTIEFPIIPKNAQQQIAMQFNNYTDNNPDIDYTSRLLQESIAEIVDSTDSTEQKTKKLVQSLETITSVKQIKVGKDVQDFFFLSGLKLTWSDKFKAFWYKGDIGLISIAGTPINKMVKGYFDYVIGKPLPNGQSMPDTLRMYLEIDEDNWVYFAFTDYILKTTGTRGGYKNIIKEVFAKQSKKKSDPNKKEMQLAECTEDTKDIFIRNFSRYLLDSGVREEVKEEKREEAPKEEKKEEAPKEEKKEEAPKEEKKEEAPKEEKKEEAPKEEKKEEAPKEEKKEEAPKEEKKEEAPKEEKKKDKEKKEKPKKDKKEELPKEETPKEEKKEE